MKNYAKISYLFLLFTIVFQSCIAQNFSQSIENAIGGKLYAKFSGKAFVKSGNEDSYLLMINSNNSSDTYDKAIILFSENKIEKPIINSEENLEFFIPDNRRYIIIYNKSLNKIISVGLSDQNAKDAVDKFKANFKEKSLLANNNISGYGLSYLTGFWNINKIKESKYNLPFNTLDYSNIANPNAAKNLPTPENEKFVAPGLCDIGQCTSGGAGSSSCSISEGFPVEQSCTVTCNTGYYACCRSSDIRCYCCKN